MSKKILIGVLAALPFFASAGGVSAQTPKTFLKMVDTDNDGTVTLEEVKAYAAKRFAALDKDKDGTLDLTELKSRLSVAGFKSANADADNTLDRNEFMAYVEKLFKEANDNDKTLDAKELATPAGKKLVTLLK